MMQQKPYFIIIYGPTGVGKTDFSLALAARMPKAEIINLDMGQLYAPLTIGTAKPDWQNQPIKHYLFDSISDPANYTVSQYRESVMQQMNELWQRGVTPILVGGSGFYAKSLFFPPVSDFPNSPAISTVPLSTENLWQDLAAIDSERAQAIHPNDAYRIQRALSLWHTTGKKPSLYVPAYQPPASYAVIHLTRDRDNLYNRINERVKLMLEQGWLDEVSSLMGTPWQNFLLQKKLIGYDDIIRFLNNEQDQRGKHDELEATIATKTRRYAKRQETFWRMLEKELSCHLALDNEHHGVLTTLNLTLSDVDLYIDELLKQLALLNTHST